MGCSEKESKKLRMEVKSFPSAIKRSLRHQSSYGSVVGTETLTAGPSLHCLVTVLHDYHWFSSRAACAMSSLVRFHNFAQLFIIFKYVSLNSEVCLPGASTGLPNLRPPTLSYPTSLELSMSLATRMQASWHQRPSFHFLAEPSEYVLSKYL